MKFSAVHGALYNKVDYLQSQSIKTFNLNYSIPDDFTKISRFTLNCFSQKNLSLLHLAALSDSLEAFIYMVKYKDSSPLGPSYDGYNSLHYACFGDSIEVASYIIALYPDLPSKDTDTPYQYTYCAVAGNSPRIVKLLLDNGVNLNSPKNSTDNPLQYAIKRKDITSLKYLLQAKRLQKSPFYYTPLMLAVINSEPEAFKLLLENGTDPSVRAQDGQTALSLNCFFLRDLNVTKMICDKLMNVDIPEDINDSAAVHWICISGSVPIAEMILAKGINVNRFDKEGNTGPYYLIDKTSENDQLKIMDLLYQHGLNLDLRFNKNRNTIFGEFINSIILYPKIIDWFLSHGANIDMPCITDVRSDQTIRSKLIEKVSRGGINSHALKEILKKHKIIE